MSFVGPRHWRDWSAVMGGDVVYDGAGRPWKVERVATEPGSSDGDGAVVVWAGLRGGIGGTDVRTLRIPDSVRRVELSEGPGHGISAASGEALTWASALITERLGGTVMDAPAVPMG